MCTCSECRAWHNHGRCVSVGRKIPRSGPQQFLSFNHAFPWGHILYWLAPHKCRSGPQRGPLSRSQCVYTLSSLFSANRRLTLRTVGWSSIQPPNSVGFQPNYDHGGGYGNPAQDIGVKGRIINLISAVRTVMRSTCHLMFLHLRYE